MIFLKLVFLFAEHVKLHFTSPILSLIPAVVGHHLMMKLKKQLLDMKIYVEEELELKFVAQNVMDT
jgi:hypothetical protein